MTKQDNIIRKNSSYQKILIKKFNQLKRLMGILLGRRAFAGPIWVQIDLTNVCNNNCIGCWCNSPLLKDLRMTVEARQNTLSLKVVKELIDDLARLGTERIFLCGGGEPTLHPYIKEIIQYIKKKGMICALNTNFTLINEEKAKQLVDLGLDEITISLWAAKPETYSKTHPNKKGETLLRIKRVIKFMQEYKKKIGKKKPLMKLYNVIFSMNYQEIGDMIKFAKEVKAESIEFAPLDPIPGRTEFLLLNEKQRKELVSNVKEIIKKVKKGEYKGLHFSSLEGFYERISNKLATRGIYDSRIVSEIPCYVGWVFTRIMANGDIIPCLKAHRMPLGNVYKDRFAKIWTSKEYNYFRYMAINYTKKNPFFKVIGNSKNGCFSSCDNRLDNINVNKRKIIKLTRGTLFNIKNR